MAAPLILAPLGPALSASETAFFRAADPWAFILFTRNLETPRQIRDLTAGLRDAVGRDAPILIDQEGGRVQRLRPPLARDWRPPLEDVAHFGAHAARAMFLRHRIIAAELLSLGIDVNCAPTLDIAGDHTHPFLRNRCFGQSAPEVIAMGRAAAGGLLEGGVLPVVKHMPGHGRGRVDSHKALPRTDADFETLRAEDFAPFRELADMPLGMSAHLLFEAIDTQWPATQSETCITIIRQDIGFDGFLLSDDISMDALAGDVATRGTRALGAGCDAVLHCNGDLAEMEALAGACPAALPKASAARADAALAMHVTPMPADIDDLVAQYAALGEGLEAKQL